MFCLLFSFLRAIAAGVHVEAHELSRSSPRPCTPPKSFSAPRNTRLFTPITMLGTPLDVTAEELRIESYFPVDAATEAALRSWAPRA